VRNHSLIIHLAGWQILMMTGMWTCRISDNSSWLLRVLIDRQFLGVAQSGKHGPLKIMP
jgi:hypothetical protein